MSRSRKDKHAPASKATVVEDGVLREIDQGVILFDAEGMCELTTPRVAELLGKDSDIGEHRTQTDCGRAMIAAGLDPAAQASLELTMATEGRGDAVFRTNDGVTILLSARTRKTGGYAVTLTDVSPVGDLRGTLDDARRRAEEAKRAMTAELTRLNDEKARIEARQEELQRLSLVAAHAKDLVVITDHTYRIIWANEAYRRHNGLDLEMDLVGKSNRDVLAGPETDPYDLAKIDEAVRSRQSLTIETRCHKRDGAAFWLEQEITPVFDEHGAHTNFIAVGRDVTERRAAETAAEEARQFETMKRGESRLLAEFNEWLQSCDTPDEVFRVVSPFLAKLLPDSHGAVFTYAGSRDVLSLACDWGDKAPMDDFEPSECWALRRGRAYYYGENTVDIPCGHIAEPENLNEDSRVYCLPIIAHGDTVGLMTVECAGSKEQDAQKLVNFCVEHISLALANVRLREQLREQSTVDPLTGLYNRRFFNEFARRELNRCSTHDRPAALISLDVDHFKNFNDTYGHDAGDLVLKSLAKLLKRQFRQGDAPCRIGGEEFVVMMPGATRERAEERAEALRNAVEEMRLSYSGETLNVTISAGVCVYPDNGETVADLMQEADRALYNAKKGGRNQVCMA